MVMIEISCREVRRELSNYMEEDVSPQLRARLEAHLSHCNGCRAVYDGVRNILRLAGSGEIFELPLGFGQRLRQRLAAGQVQ